VVGSQTASLTPGPSFAHNLGCRCPNCQCEGIFDIYVSRPFPTTPRTPQCEVFCPLLSSSEHSGVPEDSKSPAFPSVGLHPHTWPKWGCDKLAYTTTNSQPSLSNWVSTIPNPKVFQLMCNWNGCPWMGHLKMGFDESLVFNF
jgi:hypothetical protein